MSARILLVEDDAGLATILRLHFEDAGHEVHHADRLAAARQQIATLDPDLILMDQGLPDGKGYDLLCEWAEQQISANIIMITAEHDLDLAMAAISAGAFDFIHKPIQTGELDHTINRALQQQQLSRQVQVLSQPQEEPLQQPRLLGQSQLMLKVSKEIALVAQSPTRVLVTGESGTGKELVARAIHQYSGLKGPFLATNCAALVDNLLESELFGHEKGAFTGATARKPGKFELAADGTLFLDEIGELPLLLQAKLLRVLQDGHFERLGGSQQLNSGARVVVATNRDLVAEVANGRFREDLYYRLSAVHIPLPPLRDRPEDIPLLVAGLLQRICRSEGKALQQITDLAMNRLQQQPWRGNVRELENVLTQAVIRTRGRVIDLPDLVLTENDRGHTNPVTRSNSTRSLAEVEAAHIQAVLDANTGHKGKSCDILQISRPALDRKITRYGLAVMKK